MCIRDSDLSFACVGFFIILFIFLAFGIAAPLPYEVIGHGLLFVDIAIANTFLHYPDYVMMFLLGIPLYKMCIRDRCRDFPAPGVPLYKEIMFSPFCISNLSAAITPGKEIEIQSI